MPPLTARQAEVLGYIAGYIADHGFAPSSRELALSCGLGSPSGAHRMLVLLESKGYLTRSQGLSRAVSVARPPITAPSEREQEDSLALLVLAWWLSGARDAELTMAARTEDLATKSTLIDMARERQQQMCLLRPALHGFEHAATSFHLRHPIFLVQDDALVVQDELLGAMPRCESWESFVVDELVCNLFSWRVSEYVSRTRPRVRGLLWPHVRLAEQAFARSQSWTLELQGQDDQKFDNLSTRAQDLGQTLYKTAQSLDTWSRGAQALFSGGLDLADIATLV